MLFVCRILSSTLFIDCAQPEQRGTSESSREMGKKLEVAMEGKIKKKEGGTVVDGKNYFFFSGARK